MHRVILKTAFVLGASLLVSQLAACDRAGDHPAGKDAPPTGKSSSSGNTLAFMGPAETVRYVHDCRVSGRLDDLGHFLLPGQRRYIVDLVAAVDRLVWANQVLIAAVREHIGAGSAGLFDRSQVANSIGVFSKDVEVIDERIDGDKAVVTVQVANRVPLDEVRLVNIDDRWMIETDPPIEGLAGELGNLADVLIETGRRLEREEMTAAELQKELAVREAAVSRRINALIMNSPE